jgi:hypothetical protein
MLPQQQYDKLHLRVWSWLRGGPLHGHVQFNMDCELVHYENKIETTMGIHLCNFLGGNNLKGVQKPFKKDHL